MRQLWFKFQVAGKKQELKKLTLCIFFTQLTQNGMLLHENALEVNKKLFKGSPDFAALEELWWAEVVHHAACSLSFSTEKETSELGHLTERKHEGEKERNVYEVPSAQYFGLAASKSFPTLTPL